MVKIKEKRGWIRIIEAFTMILIISGVLLIVVSNFESPEGNQKTIYNIERKMLMEMQLDSSVRMIILADGNLEIFLESKTPSIK